jgi:hypothetical protein
VRARRRGSAGSPFKVCVYFLTAGLLGRAIARCSARSVVTAGRSPDQVCFSTTDSRGKTMEGEGLATPESPIAAKTSLE